MTRHVNDIVLTGQGLLVTFDDNSKNQFIWKLMNNRLTLTLDNEECPHDIVKEIIDSVNKCNGGTSLWAHLFGISSSHLSSAALGQLGTNLTPNTWTNIIYDNTVVQDQGSNGDALQIDNATGIITLPYGDYFIDASVLNHRSGSGGTDGIIVSIQGFDPDTGIEIPYSFHQSTIPALNTAPLSIRTAFLFVNHSESARIAIRIRTDSNRCSLGANNVPAGSNNHAGFLNIVRTG